MNATIRTTDDTTRAEIKTAGGTEERGPAATRHFVRQVERIDGLSVLASCDVGTVALSVKETEAFGPLNALAAVHGYEITVEGTFPSGAEDVVARLEEGGDD